MSENIITTTPVAEVTSTLLSELKPADRAVALMALAEAIKAEADTAKQEALNLAQMVGAKSFRTTMGTLTVTEKAAPVRVNETELLTWAKEHHPETVETIEQVKPWAVKQFTDRLVVVDGELFDSDDLPAGAQFSVIEGIVVRADGEVIEPVRYATLGDAPAPYVSWPSSSEKKRAQQDAREFVAGAAAHLASQLMIGAGR